MKKEKEKRWGKEKKRWSDEEADKEYNKYFTSPAPSKITNSILLKQLKYSQNYPIIFAHSV